MHVKEKDDGSISASVKEQAFSNSHNPVRQLNQKLQRLKFFFQKKMPWPTQHSHQYAKIQNVAH